MKRARRMGLHLRHDLSNPTRRCVEATIRQGLSRITANLISGAQCLVVIIGSLFSAVASLSIMSGSS